MMPGFLAEIFLTRGFSEPFTAGKKVLWRRFPLQTVGPVRVSLIGALYERRVQQLSARGTLAGGAEERSRIVARFCAGVLPCELLGWSRVVGPLRDPRIYPTAVRLCRVLGDVVGLHPVFCPRPGAEWKPGPWAGPASGSGTLTVELGDSGRGRVGAAVG